MSRELRICPGVGARKCGAFLARLDRDPHPTCTRCRGKICTKDLTCDFCAVWSAEQWDLFAKKRSYKERKHRPSGSAPSVQQTSPRAETSSGVSRPGTSSSSSSRPLGGQGKQEGSRGAPGVVSGGASSPPARSRSSERGGSASGHLSGVGGLASSSPLPSGGGGGEVARSRQTSLSRVSESVDSPSFSPHVPRRENARESSGSCSRAVSSRDSRSSVREPRKDTRARSREGGSRGRRRLSRSRSSSRSRARGRERDGRSSSASRSSRGRSRRERSRSSDRYRSRRGSSRSRRARSRSSDRYRSRRDRSRRERSRSVARDRSRRERARSPARRRGRRDRSRSHASSSRSFDRSRSRERLSASSSRSREAGAARRARRGTQEGVEAVASQPAVVPGGSGDVTPVAGGTSLTALPSAMKELARFFLNLSGSSSLGASGDSAGVTASGAVLGDLAGPSSTAPGAAIFCGTAAPPAGAGVLPDVDALPSVSGEHRRRVRSRSRDRRGRSSSDGTDRRAKKRSRRGSPSPGRSSRRRERRYRSSSDSSEVGRAAASPPRSRRAHGGARAGESTWDYDRSRSYARVDSSQSGTRHRSPGPSGVAEDDRSSTFESVDFARDVSFRAVLGLIRKFHDMGEPATVPAARCKTSLASAFGLPTDSSPSFALPLSPLLSTLLMDINSDLSKFMEDQTVHGFLPVPGRRQRRFYGTSTSSFPGPYTVPPGLTSITMEKASEVRKRSVSLSASQVSSLETMLSGMCEVASWMDWWLSTCGGFRDLLPLESRADFERLMMSGSRSLEFLASQGCTALGNLVLSRRDALLADVRGTVPVEEVARLRYSPLPLSASIFPHPLLDSALLKMRAAASDALVQRTLHPPRIPRKPVASGQGSGSAASRAGQAGTSGAAQSQKQPAPSSSSGQSGQGKKKGRGKAPFSSSSRGSGRSGGKGKGAGKKSA